ncbi:hypothetical protein CFSAN001082_04070, partial [Salmonella enterica subsp. enterica serovar Havana str. CFSAN001082]
FELQEGGKRADPQELTQVSDWGKGTQPQHMQPEVCYGEIRNGSKASLFCHPY